MTSMKFFPPHGLYAITPQYYPDAQRLLADCAAALQGGARLLQFRDKSADRDWRLEVARRLRNLIENRLGIRVVLTRDDDRAVSLDERAALANNSKADLFLSLHANAALAPGVSGAEVFHARLDRESQDALRSADEGVALPVLGGGSRTIDVIRWDLAQARHVDASEMFAGMLEEDLRAHVTMGPRPLQEGPLRVLMGADMPAALVEMAYLTNPDQAASAKSSTYQTSVTQGIYDAVLRFRAYLEERASR